MRARRGSAGDLQIDRSLPFQNVVLAREPFLQRTNGVEVEARLDAKILQPAGAPASMAVPFEEPAAHDARDFINAVAEEKSALIDGEFGLAPWKELAIQVHNGHLFYRFGLRKRLKHRGHRGHGEGTRNGFPLCFL